MSKKLYLECSTGISGDMTVAALLGLGADRAKLESVLESLKKTVGGFDTRISEVQKSAITAMDFDVILETDNHDHDMEYLYGHEMGENEHHHGEHHGDDHEHYQGVHHGDDSEYHHDHEHNHNHDYDNHDHHKDHDHDNHDHDHDDHDHGHYHDHDDHDHGHHDHDHHHDHSHVHRSLDDVIEIINSADMTDAAQNIATRVFTIVAEAEAAVHGRKVNEVHFHEVGAIDSIVDIIAAAVCYEDLVSKYEIEDTIVTKLVDGSGTIRCQHGILPVPVPAVLKIAEQTGIPLSISNRSGEFVTPTGAAFAASVATENRLPESFRVIKTGLGAGKREYEVPGILRAMIIECE